MTEALLTTLELRALDTSANLANLVRQIIQEGGTAQADHDWSEAAAHIHNIQHMIMAQAAARAYPSRFRLLGGTVDPPTTP